MVSKLIGGLFQFIHNLQEQAILIMIAHQDLKNLVNIQFKQIHLILPYLRHYHKSITLQIWKLLHGAIKNLLDVAQVVKLIQNQLLHIILLLIKDFCLIILFQNIHSFLNLKQQLKLIQNKRNLVNMGCVYPQMDKLLFKWFKKIKMIKPKIYQIPINSYFNNLKNKNNGVKYENFYYLNYNIGSTQTKIIYKSNKNSSIIDQGVNNMITSNLVAQTWGRPLQQPFCGQYSVQNSLKIIINSKIQWNNTQDHSKWMYAVNNNYVCFGDMNRMKSQWKRGGVFYCLNSLPLNQAFKKIVSRKKSCKVIKKRKKCQRNDCIKRKAKIYKKQKRTNPRVKRIHLLREALI